MGFGATEVKIKLEGYIRRGGSTGDDKDYQLFMAKLNALCLDYRIEIKVDSEET